MTLGFDPTMCTCGHAWWRHDVSGCLALLGEPEDTDKTCVCEFQPLRSNP